MPRRFFPNLKDLLSKVMIDQSEQAAKPAGPGSKLREVLFGVCPSCDGECLVMVGQFVSWEECLSCGRIRSLAWSSWQVEPVNLSVGLAAPSRPVLLGHSERS